MFADIHFIDFLRANPALAVFVTLALGFLVGKLRWRSFSLGTVTSVLLVGVVVGQLKIEIPEPAKILFFLLFLFSVGYAVGPQFFRGLKRDGLPQVGFAVVVCLLCLGSTWLCATLMGYDVAQAAGLLAGSQTMSAVLGVATDTIRQLPDGQAIDLDAMPVCYAVTYIFGTAGSAWILGTLGPRLLGGVEKVHKAALDLESKLGDDVSFTAGGYAVGPQFFRGLKRDGLPQVGFAVVVCLLCLGSTWLCATLMGYDVAQAAGLLAGSQTMSAVLGVATDTIRQLPDGQAIDLDAMPVCYAVTYIFGTAGSAWILGTLGPRLLGGVEKVHKAALDLESKLGDDVSFTAGFDPAARAIVFRAYKAENDWFGQRHTVAEFERYMQSQKKLIFVERLRQRGRIVDDVTPRTTIYPGDTLVVSGRRQYVIEEEDWIGTEVEDAELTNFSVQSLPVVVSKRGAAGQYVRNILKRKEMHGVNIRSILRAGVKIPVLAGGKLDAGDRLELVGLPQDVRRAAPTLGFSDPVSEKTGMPLVGLGIFLGGLLFGWLLMTRIGAVPLSLTVSGGVLIAGLFCGWLHARYPHVGNIPQPTLWFMNNVGLNTFIAIVGISTGPTFIQGFQEVGWSLFLIGAAATSIPLVAGIFIGRYLFRFNDALTLGCVAGARTTTAALGAVEETIQSNVPSMGYTITYAIGNTLLIIWGVVIVLLIA